MHEKILSIAMIKDMQIQPERVYTLLTLFVPKPYSPEHSP